MTGTPNIDVGWEWDELFLRLSGSSMFCITELIFLRKFCSILKALEGGINWHLLGSLK